MRFGEYKRAFVTVANTITDDPVYLERWAALYNLVYTIPSDNRFDMGSWGHQADTECGTAACAAGHAMFHPWFRARGLYPVVSVDGTSVVFHEQGFFGMMRHSYSYHSPFDPAYCRAALGYYEDKLTPRKVSEVIRAFMLYYWTPNQVNTAIAETEHVRYDVKAVHELTPWKGRRPPRPR